MIENGIQRKLKAILSADVKGYSNLMGDDDVDTVNTITKYRRIITEIVEKYDGRVVDAPGDNVLAEFSSPRNATESAIEIQRTMEHENRKQPDNRRMEFRIGINLGDIIHVEDRIYGDSVNIAARIENLAEPGGICISRGVFEQIDGKLDVDFVNLGPHLVKNIKKPVEIYKIGLYPVSARKTVDSEEEKATGRKWLAPAILLFVAAFTGIGITYYVTRPEFETASIARMAYPLPQKPSIAVLPFRNYSEDARKLGFFASGLTEDLTAALSRVPDLFVISRSSLAAYQGKQIDVKQVAEEQGVRYVLEGSIQKADDKLRITVQLIDAVNGRLLWANRFDRQANDIFALQDEIVKHVIVELQVELSEGDVARVASRGTNNLQAWLLRIEAYTEFFTFTREGMARARDLSKAAHEADPNWSRPIAVLASINWYEAKRGWCDSKEETIRLGIVLAKRAISMDSKDPLGYQALGNLYALSGQAERAIELRRKAAELAPNDFIAVAGLATRLKDFGGEQEAVELFERAMRLSPKHPWWVPAGYGVALHLVGRDEEAVASLKRAIDLKPNHPQPHAFLAAVYVELGRLNEAKAEADAVIQLNPSFSASQFIRSHTFHDSARNTRLRHLMVSAGLPE